MKNSGNGGTNVNTKPISPSIGAREDWEPLLSQQARTKLQEIEKAAFERGKLEGINLGRTARELLDPARSEHKTQSEGPPVPAGNRGAFRAQVEVEALDAESQQLWNASPDTRAEFDSLDRYLAYRRAEARGHGRVFAGRTVRRFTRADFAEK